MIYNYLTIILISYEGQWKNNKMYGKGTYLWPDGKKYIGNHKIIIIFKKIDKFLIYLKVL